MTRNAHAEPGGFVPPERGTRAFDLLPGSYNEAERTVEAVLSTGAPVSRWGIIEELTISSEGIDLGRVESGLVRLLDHHNAFENSAVLGSVIDARVEGDQLLGTIQFHETEQGERAEGMVARGELRGLSIGYRVNKWEREKEADSKELWRGTEWELLEVSLVSVPADAGASIRSTENNQPQEDEVTRSLNDAGTAPETTVNDEVRGGENTAASTPAATPQPATDTRAVPSTVEQTASNNSDIITAERARSADIMDIGQRAGMGNEAINEAIRSGQSVDVFRSAAFDHLAQQNTRNISSVTVVQDEGDTRIRNMSAALAAQMDESRGGSPEVPDGARQYMDASLVDMASEVVGHRGRTRSIADREDVLRRAFHTTSDFPIMFEGAINTSLASRYTEAQPVYRQISQQRTFADFRAHNVVRMGDFPMLKKIGEGGEIKSGTFGESKERIMVAPYAIQFALTRQMLVNDNLGAIDQVLGSQGSTVARFEEITFFAMFNSPNTKLLETQKAVFHADHGNLASAAGAISTATISKGRQAMMKQEGIDGAKLSIAPSILLVSPENLTLAEQIVAAITATKSGDVNVFSGKLTPVSTAELEGNAWYLMAQPSALPCYQWGLLDGYTAPRVRIENPFGVSGVGISLEHDFGVGAIDYRGAYKNAG